MIAPCQPVNPAGLAVTGGQKASYPAAWMCRHTGAHYMMLLHRGSKAQARSTGAD